MGHYKLKLSNATVNVNFNLNCIFDEEDGFVDKDESESFGHNRSGLKSTVLLHTCYAMHQYILWPFL